MCIFYIINKQWTFRTANLSPKHQLGIDMGPNTLRVFHEGIAVLWQMCDSLCIIFPFPEGGGWGWLYWHCAKPTSTYKIENVPGLLWHNMDWHLWCSKYEHALICTSAYSHTHTHLWVNGKLCLRMDLLVSSLSQCVIPQVFPYNW